MHIMATIDISNSITDENGRRYKIIYLGRYAVAYKKLCSSYFYNFKIWTPEARKTLEHTVGTFAVIRATNYEAMYITVEMIPQNQVVVPSAAEFQTVCTLLVCYM